MGARGTPFQQAGLFDQENAHAEEWEWPAPRPGDPFVHARPERRDTGEVESKSQMIAESNTQALVTFPEPLWQETQRIASEQNWSVNEVIVYLARVGAAYHRRAECNLKSRYDAFVYELDQEKQSRAGREMIRAIFGPESIAQD